MVLSTGTTKNSPNGVLYCSCPIFVVASIARIPPIARNIWYIEYYRSATWALGGTDLWVQQVTSVFALVMCALLVLLFLSAVAAKTLILTSEDYSVAGSHDPLKCVAFTPSTTVLFYFHLARISYHADHDTTGAPILLAGNGTLEEVVKDGQ
jgi:hypothetical protein